MRLRFTPRATTDLEDIAAHIREHNPSAALRVRATILDAMRTLTRYPESGRRQSVEGVRKLVTRKYPYLVYYVADYDADEVVVLTIQHPARERQHDDA